MDFDDNICTKCWGKGILETDDGDIRCPICDGSG